MAGSLDDNLNQRGIEMLFTNASFGLKYANSAASSTDPATVKRDTKKAHQALDTIQELRRKLVWNMADREKLDGLLDELRWRLIALGESF